MTQELSNWHKFVETQDESILGKLLADDVKFHSPFVWKPKEGKQITAAILMMATTVFEEFRYIREICNGNFWVLEFEAKVGKLTLRGVDLIELNDDARIIDFEVMIRPANALQAVGIEMSKKLAEKGLAQLGG